MSLPFHRFMYLLPYSPASSSTCASQYLTDADRRFHVPGQPCAVCSLRVCCACEPGWSCQNQTWASRGRLRLIVGPLSSPPHPQTRCFSNTIFPSVPCCYPAIRRCYPALPRLALPVVTPPLAAYFAYCHFCRWLRVPDGKRKASPSILPVKHPLLPASTRRSRIKKHCDTSQHVCMRLQLTSRRLSHIFVEPTFALQKS